jgi:hypothetical protein
MANLEKVKESHRRWRANNPEKNRAMSLKWRKNNPEKHREMNSRWRAANPEYNRCEKVRTAGLVRWHRRQARIHSNGGSFTAAEWQTLLSSTGHKCLACLQSGVKLTVDHIIPIS